jgi:hypothetical protein
MHPRPYRPAHCPISFEGSAWAQTNRAFAELLTAGDAASPIDLDTNIGQPESSNILFKIFLASLPLMR